MDEFDRDLSKRVANLREIVTDSLHIRMDMLLQEAFRKRFELLTGEELNTDVVPVSNEVVEKAWKQVQAEFSHWEQNPYRNYSYTEIAAHTHNKLAEIVEQVALRSENDLRAEIAEAGIKMLTIDEGNTLICQATRTAEAGSEFLKLLGQAAGRYWRESKPSSSATE